MRGQVARAIGQHSQTMLKLGQQLKQSLNGTLRARGVMVTRVELDFA